MANQDSQKSNKDLTNQKVPGLLFNDIPETGEKIRSNIYIYSINSY